MFEEEFFILSFESLADEVSQKGCLADQSAGNKAICASSSNVLCDSCSSRDNCNLETVRRDENCVTCNSALDPKCAQMPEVLTAQHCSIPSDGQCFERVVSSATVRGCRGLLTSLEASYCRNNTAAAQCTITTGQGSNNKIIPLNRRKCYHCDSRVDASCSGKPSNGTIPQPCKKFSNPANCLKLELNGAGL